MLTHLKMSFLIYTTRWLWPVTLYCFCAYINTLELFFNVMWAFGSSHFLTVLLKTLVLMKNYPPSAVSGCQLSVSLAIQTQTDKTVLLKKCFSAFTNRRVRIRLIVVAIYGWMMVCPFKKLKWFYFMAQTSAVVLKKYDLTECHCCFLIEDCLIFFHRYILLLYVYFCK